MDIYRYTACILAPADKSEPRASFLQAPGHTKREDRAVRTESNRESILTQFDKYIYKYIYNIYIYILYIYTFIYIYI